MKERGMILNAEMVRAILDGRKTQTRHIMTPQPDEDGLAKLTDGPWVDTSEQIYRCPFGDIGERIWVRETFQGSLVSEDLFEEYRAYTEKFEKPQYCEYADDGGTKPEYCYLDDNLRHGWRPSIHMLRWASRITLEITGVRVERVNSINEESAQAEGVSRLRGGYWKHYQPGWAQHQLIAIGSFFTLWKSIYGEESWQFNPWVWVIGFSLMN